MQQVAFLSVMSSSPQIGQELTAAVQAYVNQLLAAGVPSDSIVRSTNFQLEQSNSALLTAMTTVTYTAQEPIVQQSTY